MKFGNWNITGTSIEWTGDDGNKFEIEKPLLLEITTVADGVEGLYKWLVLATDQEWLNEEDLYDLNYAFMFAAGAYPENFNYERFDNTMEYQFEMFDGEEEDDEDE